MNRKRKKVWRRTRFSTVVWCILLGALAAPACAQTLTGTLTNATSRKPAAGDEVVLLDFSNGMQELGRTQSDASGSFNFMVSDSKQPRMLRVIHQGATYYKIAPPGSSSVHLDVYDVSTKLKDILVTADLMRIQVKGDSLQVVRLFAVKNNSAPPQTQMSDHNFEFYLPAGAQIDHCMARSAGGQPVRTFPLPQKEKNLYAFVFPLRPGETQFQVLFHMPYNGAVTINPRPVYGVEHLVVMLPKKMQFNAAPGAAFRAMTDPRQSGANVQVASNTRVGQPLAFSLSGTGTLAETKAEDVGPVQSADVRKSGRTIQDSRTAAGEIPPAAVPDRSHQLRRYMLGGLGVLLALGMISIVGRSIQRKLGNVVPSKNQPTVIVSRATSKPVDGSKIVLDDLKEQLFRLEVEHKQNRISQPEYEKAMAALHQNLDHAMAGKTVSVSFRGAE
jgi:hypothetical protein